MHLQHAPPIKRHINHSYIYRLNWQYGNANVCSVNTLCPSYSAFHFISFRFVSSLFVVIISIIIISRAEQDVGCLLWVPLLVMWHEIVCWCSAILIFVLKMLLAICCCWKYDNTQQHQQQKQRDKKNTHFLN